MPHQPFPEKSDKLVLSVFHLLRWTAKEDLVYFSVKKRPHHLYLHTCKKVRDKQLIRLTSQFLLQFFWSVYKSDVKFALRSCRVSSRLDAESAFSNRQLLRLITGRVLKLKS